MMGHLTLQTPCPTASAPAIYHPLSHHNSSTVQRLLFEDTNDSTTTNVAYSKANSSNLYNPTKRQSLARKPRRPGLISILEDGTAQADATGDAHVENRQRGTILAKPAKKVRLAPLVEDLKVAEIKHDYEYSRGDTGTDWEVRPEASIAELDYRIDLLSLKERPEEITNQRRRTIWVPSDDTTIMTIHPGAHSNTIKDETIRLAQASFVENSGLQPKAPRLSSVPPKRAPLSTMHRTEVNAVLGDVVGVNRGKENKPPGSEGVEVTLDSASRDCASLRPYRRGRDETKRSTFNRIFEPTASSQARTTASHPLRSTRPALPRPRNRRQEKIGVQPVSKGTLSRSQPRRYGLVDLRINNYTSTQQSHQRQPSLKVSLPFLSDAALVESSYAVLPNDLEHPELFEDQWLDHQETSLSQLINSLFDQAEEDRSRVFQQASLRSCLLEHYQQAEFVALYQKLTSSLDCGALKLPAGVEPPRLRDDIGLRQAFLDLWLETYDRGLLTAAVEVVVGRDSGIFPDADPLASTSSMRSVSQSKDLERFLLAFLIRQDDLGPKNNSSGSRVPDTKAIWAKTMLRSLMLIKLLDDSKVMVSGSFSYCLFQTQSAHKSSVSVLKTLARLLSPSTGDISRPLGHIGYHVQYAQCPADEYQYRIDNIAVDLRDGACVTRLVELLLYSPTTLVVASDSTVTINLPSDETLTSESTGHGHAQDLRPLTRHLKLPCPSRAQKLYNVQLALSALHDVQGLDQVTISATRADDIVDGHREKTLSFLWTLVSRWGLHLLISSGELKAEIQRLQPESTHENDLDDLGSADEQQAEDLVPLLKLWAQTICANRNLQITNLTTSFATREPLEAIVDAYSAFSPATTSTRPSQSLHQSNSTHTRTLATKLRALGCSKSFTALLTSPTPTLPSKNTTISSLAFLASRLIPLSRSHRAVTTIQRAYRLRLARRTLTRRVVLARIAGQCAVVVRTKQRITMAALVLQRAWRRVLERRIERLVGDVVAVQALARAWGVRKALGGSLPGLWAGQRRVRGGW